MAAHHTSPNSFPQQAAAASIIAFVLGTLTREQAAEDLTTARILIGVNWSLIFLGFILAVVAMASMRRQGTKSALPSALLGLLLNAAGIAAIVYYFLIVPNHRSAGGGHDSKRYEISAQQWKNYSSAEGRFAIQLPGEPRVITIEPPANDDSPRLKSRQASVALPDGSVFGVTWVDPPVLESASPAEAESLLDSLVAHRILGKTRS
jgi:hypothetical protein